MTYPFLPPSLHTSVCYYTHFLPPLILASPSTRFVFWVRTFAAPLKHHSMRHTRTLPCLHPYGMVLSYGNRQQQNHEKQMTIDSLLPSIGQLAAFSLLPLLSFYHILSHSFWTLPPSQTPATFNAPATACLPNRPRTQQRCVGFCGVQRGI